MGSGMTIDLRLVLTARGNGSRFGLKFRTSEVRSCREISDSRGLRHRILFSLRRHHIIHIDLHRCGLLNESDSQH